MTKVSQLKLNTGGSISAIGFGTWQLAEDEEVEQAVGMALKTGYRLIDTAKIYGNEYGVGAAVRASDIPREEVFVTTKLWNSDHGYDSALEAFKESMRNLNLGYIDLYLIHWPATHLRHEAWRALAEIYKSGQAKAVGVANYDLEHLEELLKRSSLVPAVDQIPFNPFVYKKQAPILEFCRAHSILVEAYSPLTLGRRIDDPTISLVAEKIGRTNAQVMLRWAIQHGTVPIPKSSHPNRIRENFEVFDFELSDNEMQSLNELSA